MSIKYLLILPALLIVDCAFNSDQDPYPPPNITDPAIILLLTPPQGPFVQTISIDIPAIPIKVNTSLGHAISLGNDLTYVPGHGLIPLDPSSEEAAKVRAETEYELRQRGIPTDRKPLCTVVVEEKFFPRQFIRAIHVPTKTDHSVDINITVIPQEIAVSLSLCRPGVILFL